MTISFMSSTKSMKHLFLRLFYKMQIKVKVENERVVIRGHLKCNAEKQTESDFMIW